MVRTTADNPFVNYQFLKKFQSILSNIILYIKGSIILNTIFIWNGVEIFRKKLLLKYKNDVSKISKEHVTTKFKNMMIKRLYYQIN